MTEERQLKDCLMIFDEKWIKKVSTFYGIFRKMKTSLYTSWRTALYWRVLGLGVSFMIFWHAFIRFLEAFQCSLFSENLCFVLHFIFTQLLQIKDVFYGSFSIIMCSIRTLPTIAYFQWSCIEFDHFRIILHVFIHASILTTLITRKQWNRKTTL